MAFFFKRELSPVERFENALKDKLAARQKLAERSSVAEAELGEKRAEAERLAVAGAGSARLDRAEANMRVVEDRAKAQRAALVEFDEQVASAERALADAKAQRDRDIMADEIEAMAAAIERATPGFDAGAATLVEAVTKKSTSIPEATRFSTSVDAIRREVLSAVDLICWELRSAAVQTRAGNANITSRAPSESEQPPSAEAGLPAALQHQHVDHLNARRVQTLMHLHGSAGLHSDPEQDDPQFVDLDALVAEDKPSAQADVA